MEKSQYIEVIDRFNRLLTEGSITRETAWWAMQAVILCAMKDYRITSGDYYYICDYRDRIFE